MGTPMSQSPLHKPYAAADPDTVQFHQLEDAGTLRTNGYYAGQWRDLPYAIAFVINCLIIAVLAAMFHGSLDTEDTGVQVDGNMVVEGLTAALGVSIVFSVLWVCMIKACARVIVWAGIVFGVLMAFAALCFSFYVGNLTMILVFGLLFVLQVMWVYCVRNRIAMAAAMLEIAVEVGNTFWGIYAICLMMIVVASVAIAVWVYATYSTLEQFDSNDVNMQYAVSVYFIFSLFWILHVKCYVVHCTGAGATGSWYFQVSEADPSTRMMSASMPSLRRACTTSFGSVCYGALIISVIETLKVMARSMRRSDNGVTRLVGCCLECLLQCIQDIVEYLNSYAFTIVAIYGDDYCSGVRKTMELFSHSGFDLIINDCLVERVLGLGSFACGLLGCGSGLLVANAKAKDFEDNSQNFYICGVGGLFIGFGMMSIVNATLIAVVKSTYMCFALDPLALYNTKRSTYDKLMDAWNERWGDAGIPCQAYIDAAHANGQRHAYPGQQAQQQHAIAAMAPGQYDPAPAPPQPQWQEAYDPQGRMYLYNPVTRETRWP